MTRSQVDFCGQWSILSTGAPYRARALKQWLRRFSSISLLAIFLSPVTGVIETGVANAQIFQNSAQRARNARLNRARPRKRSRARVRTRTRTRIVAKPKKSLFGSLFGSKPSGGNSARPFSGLNSLFDGLQGKPQTRSAPASLRASYEKRMREAARRDGLSANDRLLLPSGGASSGWGSDPTRAAPAAHSQIGRAHV